MYKRSKKHIKHMILSWLRKNAHGYDSGIRKSEIINRLPFAISDKLFWRLMEEYIEEGNIAFYRKKFWFVPLATNNSMELAYLSQAWKERRSKYGREVNTHGIQAVLEKIAECDRNLSVLEMRIEIQQTKESR